MRKLLLLLLGLASLSLVQAQAPKNHVERVLDLCGQTLYLLPEVDVLKPTEQPKLELIPVKVVCESEENTLKGFKPFYQISFVPDDQVKAKIPEQVLGDFYPWLVRYKTTYSVHTLGLGTWYRDNSMEQSIRQLIERKGDLPLGMGGSLMPSSDGKVLYLEDGYVRLFVDKKEAEAEAKKSEKYLAGAKKTQPKPNDVWKYKKSDERAMFAAEEAKLKQELTEIYKRVMLVEADIVSVEGSYKPYASDKEAPLLYNIGEFQLVFKLSDGTELRASTNPKENDIAHDFQAFDLVIGSNPYLKSETFGLRASTYSKEERSFDSTFSATVKTFFNTKKKEQPLTVQVKYDPVAYFGQAVLVKPAGKLKKLVLENIDPGLPASYAVREVVLDFEGVEMRINGFYSSSERRHYTEEMYKVDANALAAKGIKLSVRKPLTEFKKGTAQSYWWGSLAFEGLPDCDGINIRTMAASKGTGSTPMDFISFFKEGALNEYTLTFDYYTKSGAPKLTGIKLGETRYAFKWSDKGQLTIDPKPDFEVELRPRS